MNEVFENTSVSCKRSFQNLHKMARFFFVEWPSIVNMGYKLGYVCERWMGYAGICMKRHLLLCGLWNIEFCLSKKYSPLTKVISGFSPRV